MSTAQSAGKPACHKLKDAAGNGITGVRRFGAFQNFPIVKGERHIYFSRKMGGNENDETVRVLAFDVTREHLPGSNIGAQGIKLVADKRFGIKDDYDPIMPLVLDGSDMRMMSVKVSINRLARRLGLSEGTMDFYELDVNSAEPRPVKLPIEIGSSGIDLHDSWARRPIHVVESGTAGAGRKTQLVLSRSAVAAEQDEAPKEATGSKPTDEARFEFIILERAAAATAPPAPLKLVRGLTCTITYTVTKPDEDRIRRCQRTAPEVSGDRATPATMLQGAPLLVGRFSKENESQLALIDRCVPAKPIIVQPVRIEDKSAIPQLPGVGSNPRREVKCEAMTNPEGVAAPM